MEGGYRHSAAAVPAYLKGIMKKETALLVGGGIVLYLLYSKGAFGNIVPQSYPAGFIGPTQPGSLVGGVPVSASGAGSLVGWLTNLFKGGSGGGTANVPIASGGATDVTDINQIAAQPDTASMTLTSGTCSPNGNPCDPLDCSYNDQVCSEMGGSVIAY